MGLVLGPVSRILFHASRRFSRHFSRQLAPALRFREVRHTRNYRTGRPVAYFALHPMGFFVPPSSLSARWALTPPFHPCPTGTEAPVRRFEFL